MGELRAVVAASCRGCFDVLRRWRAEKPRLHENVVIAVADASVIECRFVTVCLEMKGERGRPQRQKAWGQRSPSEHGRGRRWRRRRRRRRRLGRGKGMHAERCGSEEEISRSGGGRTTLGR